MDRVDSFVCDSYKIPIKALEKFIKPADKLNASTSLDFSIVRSTLYPPTEKPELVLFMFHGWTSNKLSMVEQTRLIIREMIKRKEYICHKIWFVQVNAPYTLDDADAGYGSFSIGAREQIDSFYISSPILFDLGDEDEDDDDCSRPTQRAWWEIDGLDFIYQLFLNEEATDLFRPMPNGLEYSMEYCRQLVLLIQAQSRESAVAFLGFSQGGGMALNCTIAAAEYCANLAGLFVCSGLATNTENIDTVIKYSTQNHASFINQLSNIPIFHSHGTKDPTLFLQLGLAFRDYLKTAQEFGGLGFNHVSEFTFDGYHEITPMVRKHIGLSCLDAIVYHRLRVFSKESDFANA